MSKYRDQVFISYSRHDRLWKDRLLTHLTPLIREEGLCIWDDGLIEPGSKWREEISAALSRAKAAVLLVTPHYLASNFITNHEIPPLLKAAAAGGVRILWIAISASAFESTPIGQYQALNNPAAPLDKYKRSSGRLNEILVDIAKKIRDAYQGHVASDRASAALGATKQTTRLVLDCGMAPRVMVNQVHELRLLVRDTQSAGLRQSVDQDRIHPGGKIYDFSANDVRSVVFDVDFPLDTGHLQSVEIQIDLNAPDFRVEEQLPRTMRLNPATEAHPKVFLVKAEKVGRLVLVVRIIHGTASLGSEKVATVAEDLDRQGPAPVLCELRLDVEVVKPQARAVGAT